MHFKARFPSLLIILALVLQPLKAAASDLPDANHFLYHGYFYADGRDGDFTSEVSGYTNLYVAIPCGYLTEQGCPAVPQFTQSLANAFAAGKDILLLMGDEPIWDTVLDVATPYWSRIKLIEVIHEGDQTLPQTEAMASALIAKLASRGLPLRPLGATYARTGFFSKPVTASNLNWIAIEAYVDPPGSADAQTNINDLNGFLTAAKAHVPSSKQLILIGQGYDRNGQWTNMSTLAALQKTAYLQAYNDPRVIALVHFAYGRPGGTRQHAAHLQPAHREIGSVLRISPRMSLDLPATGATVAQPFTVAGWAIDLAAGTGTGVGALHLWAFPASGSAVFLGAPVAGAGYGGVRPDVGAAYGAQFAPSAFGQTVTGLPPGVYTINAYAWSTVSARFVQVMSSSSVTVTANPVMNVDIPASGSTVSQPFAVGGWAVDLAAPTGTGVNTLHVWAFPAAGGAPTFAGAVSYGGLRPDVGAFFGSGQWTPSGFGLTVAGLSPGAYQLNVYAFSTVVGGFNNVRVVPLSVQ